MKCGPVKMLSSLWLIKKIKEFKIFSTPPFWIGCDPIVNNLLPFHHEEPACTDTVHKLPHHLGTVPLHYEEPACTDTVHEPPPHLGTGPPNQDEPAMLVQVQITTVSLQYEEPALEDLKIYFGLWPLLVYPRCQWVYTMAGQTPALQQNWQCS